MSKINYRVLLSLFFLSLGLFLTDKKGFIYWPRLISQLVIKPVEETINEARVGIWESVSFIGFWRSGEMRIRNLEQKNWELTTQLVLLKSLQEENQSMRLQLGAKPIAAKKVLPAKVVGLSQGLEINQGSKDGVTVGMSVVYLGNLVGKVERVLPSSAFVTIPTDSRSKIPVTIRLVHAVAIGTYGSQILLDKVGQTEPIQKEDLVITSGEGGSYESGLIVGRVTNVTALETDLFRQVEVSPLVNYSKLRTVFVIVY